MGYDEIYRVISKYFFINSIEGTDEFVSIIGLPKGEPNRSLDELAKTLLKIGYIPKIRVMEELVLLQLIKEPDLVKRENYFIHLFLFFLTILSTLFVGSLQNGGNPLSNPRDLVLGIPFSFTLLTILGFHEMGHYLLSRYHGVRATLPYFIPFPHPLIGTMGAFIRIKSPIPSRNALMDIGIGGPILGLLVALPLSVYGIYTSQLKELTTEGGYILLGDSLFFNFLVKTIKGEVPTGYQLALNPIAYAAWLGFFVTALNLIPVGQLDGGHILFAISDKLHKVVGIAVIPLMFVLGFLWVGWWTWGLLILFFMRFPHPKPLNPISKLDYKRRFLGGLALLILIFLFVPIPMQFRP